VSPTPALSAGGGPDDGPRVFLSCGEASGDLYAAGLARAIHAARPSASVRGFGGDRLREAGAGLIGSYRGLSVTGLVEAASVLGRSWRMLRAIGEAAREWRPHVFVAIDFPDFNFRLLPIFRRLGVPIVYYVSPQIWAWRRGRLSTLRQYVDRMLVIFPFEVPIYEDAGVPVEFVGHPLIDVSATPRSRHACRTALSLRDDRPVLALLPGSRPNELRHVLPTLTAAAPAIAAHVPGVQFVVARAPALEDTLFAPLDSLRRAGLPVVVATDATDDVLAASDAVITASGTATVQTALHGRPMAIVYRLSPVTYAIGRRVVRVPAYGMVNLVAGRTVVPELIQDALTPQAVAREAISLLTDRARIDAMQRDLADVRARLGGPGASARAAAAVLAVAEHRASRVEPAGASIEPRYTLRP
jgi:lipid-A-disaccharide synthase